MQIKDQDLFARTGIPYYHEDKEKCELLRTCDELKGHRVEIAAFFAEHEASDERGDFLRSFFSDTFTEQILSNGQRAGYRAWDNGLDIWRGSWTTREKEVFIHWSSVAQTVYGMILLQTWLDPDERLLPTEGEQIAFIDKAESEKDSAFVLPQEAIDYVLRRGDEHTRHRIYEFFLQKRGAAENIRFLKSVYGIGGRSDAIPGSGYWENHDGKGISISRSGYGSDPQNTVLLKWTAVEKRIGELIALDRYLTRSDKESYPAYLAEKADREERGKVGAEFKAIVDEYKDFTAQIGAPDGLPERWLAGSWASSFTVGRNDLSDDLSFVINKMRETMQTIIDEDTHLTERCEAVLGALDSDLARALELPEDEQRRSEPKKQYVFSLGDTVYIGLQEFEVLAYDDDEVRLYDPEFPLFNKVLPREEFDRKLSENPRNQHLLQVVEDAPEQDEPVWVAISQDEEIAEAKRLINEYCGKEFDSEADFSDLACVPLAYTTIEESDTSIQVSADLVNFRMIFEVGGKEVSSIDFRGLRDMNEFLDSLDFDELVRFAEEQYELSNAQAHETPADEPVSEETTPEIEPLPEPIPAPASTPRRKVAPTMLHPEVPTSERHDYRITDDTLGVGTPSERYAANVRAIQLLKQIEAEGRLTEPEEQEVLARYVGWGGLADSFDERSSRYAELKELLAEDEYESARESTLTAFYTPPAVIRAMYAALDRMNFKCGNILEPSCGIGHFIGMLPEKFEDTKIYGVELDSISGRIARQLYQNSSVAVQGYENTDLPDSFFDVAIGNIPFGAFKVSDKRYDKHNLLIHDYFFAKTLDKVRPGGIVAFVTSKGTMDKATASVRKYIAQRAELVGAIRLPNDTFKGAAGTEVTSDILFFQKRDRLTEIDPEWVHIGEDENGLKINQYFVDNPQMVLGEMREISGPFGADAACFPREGQDLEQLLNEAVQNITAEMPEFEPSDPEAEEDRAIPADPSVRNYSFAVLEDVLYYRENSRMIPANVTATAESRIRGLIDIRDELRNLIEVQTENYPDEVIANAREKLNRVYDEFVAKYGRISSRANASAFRDDSSYYLLSSLEVLDDERNFERKADIFSKRTIRQYNPATSVDTASEALMLSLAEKAKVDMPYMSELTGKTEQELVRDLTGVVFADPEYREDGRRPKYITADEYLSGNVREKLAVARKCAEQQPETFAENVRALEAVQPQDLTAAEISVRLGTTWLPEDVVDSFIYELFDVPYYLSYRIKSHFSKHTGAWNVEGKSVDRGNIKATSTYGTQRINGYKIIEDALNLRDVRIFDYIEDDSGKRVPVLNRKETAIAQAKQELIKQAFADWVWSDPDRRARLCRLYNDKFNATRPREFDGSHLSFPGMNPEITLRPHQLNAIARILYGGNTLLAHAVGAGKTYEMVAAAQESKRLGLCSKSLIVVPNHLTEQWAAEYLRLYPAANILVATKRDFEARNRKRFCGRIATGDYDAIIIGHSQFEKIPMSVESQRFYLTQQRDEILAGIQELKSNRGERFTIKQLERSKKLVQAKLDKLNDQSRKDDLVTFEELGVDRIFVDEAHYYKNLAANTKMRNVGGIGQTEAQKSSDLYMKCRYLDDLTGSRGVIFATGTPISNTMVEMYTMQRYLQYDVLKEKDLIHFDAWASTFGETVTAIELAPEGSGYRAKTRFSKFYNLPELMTMFKMFADVQTPDMLDLPVPKVVYKHIALKPSEHQKEMVAALAERAEAVRNREVDSSTDNMLMITNDGRKLALDQRLINPLLPDSETGKVVACAENVFEIWQRTAEQRSTQMVFCDLSIPRGDGQFNVYDDLRDKLIAKGIPAEEIAYIHSANTEVQKQELFGKVRSGQIRVLLGSTQKMGAGTNVQQLLVALHHLDCPWRPSDLQQREGRIIRQGNQNDEVEIYTYVTEATFDSYLYQLVESKQKFIGQVMTSKSPSRSAEDIDETALSYAEIKALCTGNPYIKEKMDLDISVQRLRLLKSSHLSEKYSLEDQIARDFPQKIAVFEQRIEGYKADIAHRDEHTHPNEDGFSPMEIEGKVYADKKEAGSAILRACRALKTPEGVPLGCYRGFEMSLSYDALQQVFVISLKNKLRHKVELGTDLYGNILRIDNALDKFEEALGRCERSLTETRAQLESAKIAAAQPFAHEAELTEKSARLDELNILLGLDTRENEIVDDDRDEEDPPERARDERER